MWRWLGLTHLYTGLVLSLLLFVLAVTGAALVYKEAYWRLVYPELRRPDPALEASSHAEAIAAAHAHFGERLNSVKLPEPGVPAYHVYLHDGQAFLSVDDYHVIDEWRPNERLMALLFDLHAHWMAGETGELAGGFLALGGVFMSITGLVLWWRARRAFRLCNLWPSGMSRRRLISWHRDLGTVMAPLLLLLLLTGAGLVFYETAQKWMNGLFGDPVPAAEPPVMAGGPRRTLPDAGMIRRSEAAFDDARLVFYYAGESGDRLIRFRLRQGCELHPNGRSYVYLDAASGDLVRRDDACSMPPGERLVHMAYPLHSGKTPSAAFKFAVLAGALVLAALAASGVLAYAGKLRRPQQSPGHPRSPSRVRARSPGPRQIKVGYGVLIGMLKHTLKIEILL